MLDGVPASSAEVWTLRRGRLPRVSLLRCPAGCTSRNACSNQAVRARIPVPAGHHRGRSQPPGIPRDRVRTSRIHPETDPRLQLLPCPAVPPPLLRARPNALQESEPLPDRKRCHVRESVALRAVAELVGHPQRAGQTQLSPVRSTSASAKACIRKEWRIVNAWQR